MTAAASATVDAADEDAAKPKGGKKKLILIAVPLLLGAIGGGLWFSGIAPKMLGMSKPVAAEAAKEAVKKAEEEKAPVFIELPELVANLNGGRRASYVKLKARLQLAHKEDAEKATLAMPKLVDLFQTYLREMRPEELRGSAGTYRLREELINRAQIALAPLIVLDVLFTELLVQ
jgi:flagellar FliL protein